MGMEIFNMDDLSDDFLELNEEGLLNEDKDDLGNNIQTGDDDTDKDKDKSKDDDELELILPPSIKGDDKDKNITSDEDSLTNNPKFFSSLVLALKEGGVLADVDGEEVKNQEDFLKLIDDSVKQREFEDLNPAQKEYLEAIRAGIPHEEVVEYQRDMADYDSITDEELNEESDKGTELRRNIIMVNYMSKGFTEARAKKLTDKIIDDGEDITEATDSLAELRTNRKAAFDAQKAAELQNKRDREEKEKAARSDLDKLVKETEEIIPGLKIPINIKNQVVKGLTSPVGYTKDNRPLDIISKYLHENPIEGRFKLGYLLTVTNGLKKLDLLENKAAKKNAFKDLERQLRVKETGGALEEDGNAAGSFDFDKWDF